MWNRQRESCYSDETAWQDRPQVLAENGGIMTGNALKVTASEAPELFYLSEMLARYVNAGCHFDLRDMPEAERLAEVETLKAWIEELLA